MENKNFSYFLIACLAKKGELSKLEFDRAHHVITENERCLLAKTSLENGDLSSFGELMYQSHESLRDKFQVSCEEIDLLVNIVSKIEGFQNITN